MKRIQPIAAHLLLLGLVAAGLSPLLSGAPLLATVCVAQDRPAEESVDQIITTLKKAIVEKNDPMRNRMFFKLRKIGKPAVKPLVGLLSDSQTGVAEYAVFTLGWIADPEAIDPMVKFLSSGNVSQKRAALQALGNMAWGTDEKVRKEVHSRAVPKMIEFLTDREIRVRREAAYGLGLAGDPKAISHLEKYVSHEDILLSFLAKEAIDRIRSINK